MRRCTVHALAQLINLMNHARDILLICHGYVCHNLRKGVHVLRNIIHILEAGLHRLLHFLIAKDILKGSGDIFHALHQIAGRRKEFVHTAAGSTLERAALSDIAAALLSRRNNAHKLFTHDTIGSNRKDCSLWNLDIIINLGNNLDLVGSDIYFLHRTHLYACIAYNMARHQAADLRIVNTQLIALFAKAKGSHKGDNACQHYCSA